MLKCVCVVRVRLRKQISVFFSAAKRNVIDVRGLTRTGVDDVIEMCDNVAC